MLVVWYITGLLGALLGAQVRKCGIASLTNTRPDPWTVLTLLKVALFGLAGPFAWLAAAIWGTSWFFEKRPMWEWRWVQPIRRALNTKVWS